MNNRIERWRAEINAIDEKLRRLLNKRARLAAEIGRLKRRSHAPLWDPEREREVLAQACASNDGPLDEQAIKKIFKTIMDESRRIQSNRASAKSSSKERKRSKRKE